MKGLEKMTQKSQEAIQRAVDMAQERRHSLLEPVHIYMSLLESGGVVPEILRRCQVPLADLKGTLENKLKSLPQMTGASYQLGIGPSSSLLFQKAGEISRAMGDSYISTEHFILSALEGGDPEGAKWFQTYGNIKENFRIHLNQIRGGKKVTDDTPENKYEVLKKYTRDLTQIAFDGKLDPVIGRDDEIRRVIQVLSRRTKNNPVLVGEPGVGKTAIAEGLALRIVNKDVPDVLQDKKLLALDLAAMVAGAKYRGEFEDRLKALIKEVASSEGQIVLFIDELHTLVGAGKTDGAMDAGQMLKPALARGELRAIGATTLDEYKEYIEKDKALERRFQTILVEEPQVEDAITILRGLKEKYEVHHGVRITDKAIVQAVKLSHRYISHRFLPDKAIDLMDEAASCLSIEINSVPSVLDEVRRRKRHLQIEREALKRERGKKNKERLEEVGRALKELSQEEEKLSFQWEKEKEQIFGLKHLKEDVEKVRLEIERAEREGQLEKAAKLKYGQLPDLEKKLKQYNKQAEASSSEKELLKEEVGPEEIATVVSKWTGVPVEKMLQSHRQRLLDMEKTLVQRVVGQDSALSLVSNAVRRSRAELGDPLRPIGSFLFLGPTGVGKTETVKALAEFLFDSEEAVIRLDMSEYMEKHSVARLLGAPPGYVGYEQGGQLTESVRRRPYSVILFDEIEKAHPDIFNVLLQVLDDGRLTDGQGLTVDFRNTVIIMTSNLGSSVLSDEKLTEDQKQKAIDEALKHHFRPEFLNRIDEIVNFNTLEEKQIYKIVEIQIEKVCERLREKNISLKYDKTLLAFLAQRGLDPLYGARPLKRVIQRLVLNPLSQKLIAGDISEGSQVQVKAHDLALEFKTL